MVKSILPFNLRINFSCFNRIIMVYNLNSINLHINGQFLLQNQKKKTFLGYFWELSTKWDFFPKIPLRQFFTNKVGLSSSTTTSTRSRTLRHLFATLYVRIYLQLCMWDDYHVSLIATLVFTRLLLNEFYHLIELSFEWLMMQCLFVYLMNCERDFIRQELYQTWQCAFKAP